MDVTSSKICDKNKALIESNNRRLIELSHDTNNACKTTLPTQTTEPNSYNNKYLSHITNTANNGQERQDAERPSSHVRIKRSQLIPTVNQTPPTPDQRSYNNKPTHALTPMPYRTIQFTQPPPPSPPPYRTIQFTQPPPTPTIIRHVTHPTWHELSTT